MLIEEEIRQFDSASRLSYTQSHFNDFYKSFETTTSTNSLQNMTSFKYSNLKLTYTIVTFVNTVLGLFTIFHHGSLIKDNLLLVFFYLISYTFLWPITLIFALITSCLILLFKKIINEFAQKSDQDFDADNFEISFDNFRSYLIVSFVIVLIILYTLSVPYSLYMIHLMLNHKMFLAQYKSYLHIYLFISVNLSKAIVIFIVAFYVIFKQKFESDKFKIDLDEDFIKQVEMEIEQANKFSGVISPSKDLIKLNSMFNRQYYQFDSKKLEVNELKKNLDIREESNKNSNATVLNVGGNNQRTNENNEQIKFRIKNTIKTQTLDSDLGWEDKNKKGFIKSLTYRQNLNGQNMNFNSIANFNKNRYLTKCKSPKNQKRFIFDENIEYDTRKSIGKEENLNVNFVDNNNTISLSKSIFSNNLLTSGKSKSKDDIDVHLGVYSRTFKLFEEEKINN